MIRISELIITMQLNSKAIFVAYLLLLSLCVEGKLTISRIAFIQRRAFHTKLVHYSGSIFNDVVCLAMNCSQTAL